MDGYSVGVSVLVDVGGREGSGVVRYLGPVATRTGTWVGIELGPRAAHQGLGRNDGVAFGTRYFSCPPGYGLFLPPSRVKLLSAPKSSNPVSPVSPAPPPVAPSGRPRVSNAKLSPSVPARRLSASPRRISEVPRPPSSSLRAKTPTRVASTGTSNSTGANATARHPTTPGTLTACTPTPARSASRTETPSTRSITPTARPSSPRRPGSAAAAAPGTTGRVSPTRRPRLTTQGRSSSIVAPPQSAAKRELMASQPRRPSVPASSLPGVGFGLAEARSISKGRRTHTPHMVHGLNNASTTSDAAATRAPLAPLPPPPSPERLRALEEAAASRSNSPSKHLSYLRSDNAASLGHSRTQSAHATIPDPSRLLDDTKAPAVRPLAPSPIPTSTPAPAPTIQAEPAAVPTTSAAIPSPPPSLPALPKFFQSPRSGGGPSSWFGPRRSGTGSPTRSRTPYNPRPGTDEDHRIPKRYTEDPTSSTSAGAQPSSIAQSTNATSAASEVAETEPGPDTGGWHVLCRSQTVALAVVLRAYQDLFLSARQSLSQERTRSTDTFNALLTEHEKQRTRLSAAVRDREKELETAYNDRLRELEETYRTRQGELEQEWTQRELDLVSTATAAAQAQIQAEPKYERKVSDGPFPLNGRREPSGAPRNFLSSKHDGRNVSAVSAMSVTSAALDAAALESRVDALESRLATALAESERLQSELLDAHSAAERAERVAHEAQDEVAATHDRGAQELSAERERRLQLERVVRGLEGECERYRQQLEDVQIDGPAQMGLTLGSEFDEVAPDEKKVDSLGAALERARAHMTDQELDLCDDCGERGHRLENCPYAQVF